MPTFERFTELSRRLHGYAAHEWPEVLVELAIIWAVVYFIVRFLRGTRGARVIKGLGLILLFATLVIQVLGRESAFERLKYLYSNALTFITLAMVIVFQPELRRALTRLGEASLFRQGGVRTQRVIDQIAEAVAYMSKNKIGALIALERQVGLGGLTETGTRLDAVVTAELLSTIFWPGSALHDMGVVIRGDRVVSAAVQFPLAEGEHFSTELGSRHRSGIGLSQETDALVVIVSEETGTISLAERGQMVRHLTIDQLRKELGRGLAKAVGPQAAPEENHPEEAEPHEAV
ncbi:MAG: TIGR00159 family protein [Phycisphaeraceae bacterium]|nr:TIGR00159 family protein [Phycisphaeraceae bacterium]